MEIFHDRCEMVHSGFESMDPQILVEHLISLEENIKLDLLIFTESNGNFFVLEAIHEFWGW
jgi:hypothetical protein